MKILVTGCSGFLGSHIAETLCSYGHNVLAIKRTSSRLDNCCTFVDKVIWLDCDSADWLQKAILFDATVIIHSAWSGVNSIEREDWNVQLKNISFVSNLLYIAEHSSVKKIIALGSQAEYGQYNECIDEGYPVNPITKYGVVKLSVLEMLSSFAKLHHMDWYWLRVFSIYGERESADWFFPSVIKTMLSGEKEMDFTPGEQTYSYLYVKDFAKAVCSILESENKSGIYNLSASHSYKLADVLLYLQSIINPDFKMNLGALSYRNGQSMFIGGDSSKFISAFGRFEISDFYTQLISLVEFYRKKKNEAI